MEREWVDVNRVLCLPDTGSANTATSGKAGTRKHAPSPVEGHMTTGL